MALVGGGRSLLALKSLGMRSMKLRASILFLLVAVAGAWRAPAFTLQILHASDFEAGIPALDDAPRFSSVVEGLKAAYPTNTVVLSSGDNYIVGPFMNASADPAASNLCNMVKGRGDILILNAIGIQAAAFGNHEFDDNTALVKSLLRPDAAVGYPGTAFPYFSANVVFTNDSNLKSQVTNDLLEAASIPNRIARSCTIAVGGETLGIVGATTPELATLSSPGGALVLTNVAAEVQGAVDALTNAGIDKIILLAHLQQIENEIALAGQLRGVDVIIAGGSHALMAKPSDRLRSGDVRYGDYPVAANDLDGHPVYVLNTAANYRYVGRFVAEFDAGGTIVGVSGLSGAYATDDQGVIDAGSHAPAAAVTNVVGLLAGIIDAKDGNLFGRTVVYLNGIRESVRTEETNLGDLTADANLYRGWLADPETSISLKNGGGIRDSIGAILSEGGEVVRVPPPANPRVGKADGDVSQLDIENALRFNNALALVTLTAQQLRDAMEWSVAGSGTPGQFPQVGGMEFSFNPTNAAMTYYSSSNGTPTNIAFPGERLRSLVALRADGQQDLVVENGLLVGDPARTFRMATLAFMVAGGDRYFPLTQGTSPTNLADTNAPIVFETDGAEQKALADYLVAAGTWEDPDAAALYDERIQRLSVRRDGVLDPEVVGMAKTGAVVTLAFSTLPGKEYKPASAASVTGSWAQMYWPVEIVGDGYERSIAFTPSESNAFYRVEMVP